MVNKNSDMEITYAYYKDNNLVFRTLEYNQSQDTEKNKVTDEVFTNIFLTRVQDRLNDAQSIRFDKKHFEFKVTNPLYHSMTVPLRYTREVFLSGLKIDKTTNLYKKLVSMKIPMPTNRLADFGDELRSVWQNTDQRVSLFALINSEFDLAGKETIEYFAGLFQQQIGKEVFARIMNSDREKNKDKSSLYEGFSIAERELSVYTGLQFAVKFFEKLESNGIKP